MHLPWRLLVLHSAGNLILGDASLSLQNQWLMKDQAYAENHRVQAVENPPGEKLAANWNDCSFLIFNVFHHHYCCQSLLSIKLHKIQTLGNKHQCLSAYVKSQFFLYSNFAWKLLLVRCTLQLSPTLQSTALQHQSPAKGKETRSVLCFSCPMCCLIPKACRLALSSLGPMSQWTRSLSAHTAQLYPLWFFSSLPATPNL